ncbi:MULTISPECIES: Bax inhibitor-1/YccA family protein [unclassified Lactobacillus]|uniref:Bax inhibitor-1/YccA family protein n=1 Tax=unclassified Lactobacillus TaxID=2620435 RepID=UPI000EFD29D9|nr:MULTISPECIES: Bax inhibitor-1/YccA family protein [unclassified Lactobacillus]RMC40698.1 Bax inhibitor-1/YccA family protein [Lactobacillus sp. ESL0237]RMC44456.1 Bax inhibitor-1/YccA family protein [Lactobacillus sp. ESL0234]RMC45762.1 Bax inhibitor-1/YccA family protein [Lactobacillus sp. ESL0236]RMC51154.1 Bax inhibitor-1/YccA family protein [Lactobacillus sp. ESL0225]
MNIFDTNSDRRQIHTIAETNRFLTKMYALMGGAVMISALVAYLTMNVFSTALMNLPATIIWLILLVPLGLSLGISFKANRNPAAALVMLIFLAAIYGFEFALIAGFYTGTQITSAFISAAAVFIAMAIFGTFTKRDLSNWNSYLSAALFGFMVAWLVNLFLRNPAVTYLFSFIGVIIFTGLVASDANKMKAIYNNYGDQLSSNGLAILGALQLYLDFINIFMFLLEIFGGNGNRRN